MCEKTLKFKIIDLTFNKNKGRAMDKKTPFFRQKWGLIVFMTRKEIMRISQIVTSSEIKVR